MKAKRLILTREGQCWLAQPERSSSNAQKDELLPCPPPSGVTAGTSTATLKSTMETLVLRCQHTCTIVLPRWGAWRSNEVREALRSSSDSWSATVTSSGDSAGCDKRLLIFALQEEPFYDPSQDLNGLGWLGALTVMWLRTPMQPPAC